METVASSFEFLYHIFYIGYGLTVLAMLVAFFVQLLRGRITLEAMRSGRWSWF